MNQEKQGKAARGKAAPALKASGEILFRRMEEADAMSVFPLMQEFYDRRIGADRYEADLLWRNMDRCVGTWPYIEGWVMTDRVMVMGYAIVSFGYDATKGKTCVRVEEMYVSPPFRGQDPGSLFLRALPGLYPEAACATVQIQDIREAEVYRRCGYGRQAWVLFS